MENEQVKSAAKSEAKSFTDRSNSSVDSQSTISDMPDLNKTDFKSFASGSTYSVPDPDQNTTETDETSSSSKATADVDEEAVSLSFLLKYLTMTEFKFKWHDMISYIGTVLVVVIGCLMILPHYFLMLILILMLFACMFCKFYGSIIIHTNQKKNIDKSKLEKMREEIKARRRARKYSATQ